MSPEERDRIAAAFNVPALIEAGREAVVRAVHAGGLPAVQACVDEVLRRVIERARGLP